MRLRPLPNLLALCCLYALLGAQKSWQVPGLTVKVNHGQSFLIWPEVSGIQAPDSYAVYVSPRAILTAQDLAKATLLAVVPKGSYWNRRAQAPWVLESGALRPGKPLQKGQGFFVNTQRTFGNRWYAVLSRRGRVENQYLGNNRSQNILEKPRPTKPILQRVLPGGRELHYAHFSPKESTAFEAAMSNREGRGFNYRIVMDPGAKGPRPLVFVLHSRGRSYLAFPAIGWLPKNAIQVLVDDDEAKPVHSMWLGYHQGFGKGQSPAGLVGDYTEQRILWTLDRVLEDKTLQVDPARVYAIGASLGAIAAVGLGLRHGDRFAAVGGVDPAFGVQHADFALKAEVASLFGTPSQNLITVDGSGIYDFLDYTKRFAALAGQGSAPMLFTFGRADIVTGWADKVPFAQAIKKARLPVSLYWDVRAHAYAGAWTKIEDRLFNELFEIRLDTARVAFHGLNIDNDIGKGSRFSGDLIGTVGGYVRWKPSSLVEKKGSLQLDFGLKNDKARLDFAPQSLGLVNLDIRGLKRFTVLKRSLYVARMSDRQGNLLEQRFVQARANGTLSFDSIEVDQAGRKLVVQPYTPLLPSLELAGSARLTGKLRIGIFGKSQQLVLLFLGSQKVAIQTTVGLWQIGDPVLAWAGVLGADPIELALAVPASPQIVGTTLLGQALVGSKVTQLSSIRFRK